jgi:hypothetical protein
MLVLRGGRFTLGAGESERACHGLPLAASVLFNSAVGIEFG